MAPTTGVQQARAEEQVTAWLIGCGWGIPIVRTFDEGGVIAWDNANARSPMTLAMSRGVLEDLERGGDASHDLETLHIASALETWDHVFVRAARVEDERPTPMRDRLYIVERLGP